MRLVLGEFCTEMARYGSRWASFVSACRTPHGAIPPIGGGEAASQPGVVPTVQTTSVKNTDDGVLRASWSAFWA